MLSTVKAHVFKEMRQSSLTFQFLERAHSLSDKEVGALLGIIVVLYIIGQSIGQNAGAHGGVGWNHLLCDASQRKSHACCNE